MNKDQARDLALAIWSGPREAEMPRLKRIDDAMRTRRPDEDPIFPVILPKDAPPTMRELARKSPSNYLPLILEVFRQSLRVEGYLTKFPEQTPMVTWQRNRMDARQGGLTDSALKYGAAYARVVPGITIEGDAVPSIRMFTPKFCTAVYQDPEADEWPFAAIYLDGRHLTLVDEEAEYVFGWEYTNRADLRRVILDGMVGMDPIGMASLTFIERRPHDLGLVPIIRYRDRMYLKGEEQFGIIEPLLTLQSRIDEGNFGQLVAQYFTAFRQRYVIGWTPESEAEEVRSGAARVSYFDADPEDIRVGDWGATDTGSYIDMGAAARRDLAAIAQVPAQVMGVDAISNISDATLAGLETAKNRKSSEIAVALGESHEQMLRFVAFMEGHLEAAREYDAEVRWAEREARSWAGTIDGLSKLVAAEILGPDTAVEMVPGFTDQQVDRARSDARKMRSSQMLSALRSKQANTLSTRGIDARADGGLRDRRGVQGSELTDPGRPD